MLKKDGLYFAYLRKSREDRDAESNGAADTLARHEYIIRDFAGRLGIKIARWYKEVVSGETIADRPEMTALLGDIEKVHPDGVLVVEVERLSRGNPQDQGRVMDTFKYSHTLIITPMKTYDLNTESDEEWIDFGLLRSRMEYRTIKRRLQNGRLTSAMQGKYIGNVPPYGWQREKLMGEKGFCLVPDPETAWVVKLMYQLLDSGNEQTGFRPVGCATVARLLNSMGIPSPGGGKWQAYAVAHTVKNPVHAGMVRILYRAQVSTLENGERKKSRPVNHESLCVPARWEGQIDRETFDRVRARLDAHTHIREARTIQNPLAGLLYCSVCKKPMQRRPKGKRILADSLMCFTRGCPTVASYSELVENRVIRMLENILTGYRIDTRAGAGTDWEAAAEQKEQLLRECEKNRAVLRKQLDKIHTCFEQDIYDMETFLSRSREVQAKLQYSENQIWLIVQEIEAIRKRAADRERFIPRFEGILDSYQKSADPGYKNSLLKEIVERIDYTKTVRGMRGGKDNGAFTLDIHLKLRPV